MASSLFLAACVVLAVQCGGTSAAQMMMEDSRNHNHTTVHNVDIPCDLPNSMCYTSNKPSDMAYWNVTGSNVTFPVMWKTTKTELGECKQSFFSKFLNKVKEQVDKIRNKRAYMSSNTGTAVVNAEHIIEFENNPTCCLVLPYASQQWGICDAKIKLAKGCCAELERLVNTQSSASGIFASMTSILAMLLVTFLLA